MSDSMSVAYVALPVLGGSSAKAAVNFAGESMVRRTHLWERAYCGTDPDGIGSTHQATDDLRIICTQMA